MNTNIILYSSIVTASIMFSALFFNLAYSQSPDYELQEISPDVYVVSANGYNSMFLITQEES